MTKDKSKIWSIIPAAGTGRRMNADRPKQYLLLGGKAVLTHSVEAILKISEVAAIVIGIAPGDTWFESLELRHESGIHVTHGGAERAHSVLRCIHYLSKHLGAQDNDWVLVHDGVRPCVSSDDINKLIEVCQTTNNGGLLGCEIVDTVKRVDQQGMVISTEPRDLLWRAMTPQLFPLATLARGLQVAIDNNQTSTDESLAVEQIGVNPIMVAGSSENIKITRSGDLELARMILGL